MPSQALPQPTTVSSTPQSINLNLVSLCSSIYRLGSSDETSNYQLTPRKQPRDLPHTMEIITEKDFVQAKPAQRPAVVKFVNFSKTAFTWTWNKIPYTFLPGEENAKYMERALAIHFATHLVNRELLARGRENDTSPRKPEENPYFMELFRRCVIEVDAEKGPTDQTKLAQDAIDRNMKAQIARKDGKSPKTAPSKANSTKKGQKADETADKHPSPEELARMTGQSEHRPKLNNQPASKADEDFEVIEPDADEDEA